MVNMYKGNPAVSQRRDGKWEIKLVVNGGMLTPDQIKVVAEVASKYGEKVHLTMRQEVAIFGLEESDLDTVLAELEKVDLRPGSMGMTVRNVIACVGDTYCFKSTKDTQALAKDIAAAFTGLKTPGPFKIAVSGCPFPCTRPQVQEIGLMGRVKPEVISASCTGCGKCLTVCKKGAISIKDGKAVIDYDKCVYCGRCITVCPEEARYSSMDGWSMFVGGRGSWPPMEGLMLHEFIATEDIIPQLQAILDYYIEESPPKTRLREFINKVGWETFKERVHIDKTVKDTARH